MPLSSFRGGIHPPDKKELSSGKPISETKPPVRVVIPLSQHLGAPCKPVITIGQEVKKGDIIGEPTGFVSAPVHASVSGKVIAIGEFLNAMGKMVSSVVIENDGNEEWTILKDHPDYMALASEEMKEKIRNAGYCRDGRGCFSSSGKAVPPERKTDRHGHPEWCRV